MTWKQINEQKLSKLHPLFAKRVQAFLEHLESVGIPCLVAQGVRTWAEQDDLYAQGRTKPGKIVTKAPGGHSQHNFGLAVDLCPDDVQKDGLQLDWNDLHPAWKTMLADAPKFGLAEGAAWRTFPDNPHFYPAEIPAITLPLREQYQRGGMQAVWKWFESRVQL